MSAHVYSDFQPGQKVRQDNLVGIYDGDIMRLEGYVHVVSTGDWPIQVVFPEHDNNTGILDDDAYPFSPNELIIIKEA